MVVLEKLQIKIVLTVKPAPYCSNTETENKTMGTQFCSKLFFIYYLPLISSLYFIHSSFLHLFIHSSNILKHLSYAGYYLRGYRADADK